MMTQHDRLPNFPFCPKDFLSDAKVVAMDARQLGCYWRLCCHYWVEGCRLPYDIELLARLCGDTTEYLRDNEDRILAPFGRRRGRLTHARLDADARRGFEMRAIARDSGKRGAKKRWRKSQADQDVKWAPYRDPIGEPIGSPWEPNSFDLSCSSQLSSEASANASASSSSREPAPLGSARRDSPEFAVDARVLTAISQRGVIPAVEVERWAERCVEQYRIWLADQGRAAVRSPRSTFVNWVCAEYRRAQSTGGEQNDPRTRSAQRIGQHAGRIAERAARRGDHDPGSDDC